MQTNGTVQTLVKLGRIPTGISSFDPIVRGGFPSGSLVLLLGEPGAGKTEFVHTSAAMLSLMKSKPGGYRDLKQQLESFLLKDESLKLPESLSYISFARSKVDVLREIERSFPPEFARNLSVNMAFKDLSSMPIVYSKDWESTRTLGSADVQKEIFKEFVSTLDSAAPNSIVVIASLNHLINICKKFMDWTEILSFLKDLQRQAKQWDGIVYLLLNEGILEEYKEKEVMEMVDGILVFKWVVSNFSRQQALYIQKFRGLLPLIDRDNIVRFDTAITKTDGFVVTNIKRISGRR
ncbi:MAG: ATPase domain-containing protein [Candidatus Methanoperedens sp.]|nr:ATPase domain-containing protein [Candidatus Methanoperedens sp.]